jgi:hypothetical protein
MNKSIKWVQAAAVRVVRTSAQTAIGLIGTGVFVTDVSWTVVVSGTLMASILSVLTSLASLPEVKEGE